ncbi:unnamed protein product, partial [Choristocarpus tenellus]
QVDDQEVDLDQASVREASLLEELRRMEVTQCVATAARDRKMAVHRERMRWAVSLL